MPRISRDQSGQVTVLVIGMAMVVFAVSGVALDGTRAFLARRALQNVADAASLAAADQVDEAVFYGTRGERIEVDPQAARAVVADLAGRLPGSVQASVGVDGSTVRVELRSVVETRFLRLIGVEAMPVSAVALAAPEVGAVPP